MGQLALIHNRISVLSPDEAGKLSLYEYFHFFILLDLYGVS